MREGGGSCQRHMTCVTHFARCANKKTHGHGHARGRGFLTRAACDKIRYLGKISGQGAAPRRRGRQGGRNAAAAPPPPQKLSTDRGLLPHGGRSRQGEDGAYISYMLDHRIGRRRRRGRVTVSGGTRKPAARAACSEPAGSGAAPVTGRGCRRHGDAGAGWPFGWRARVGSGAIDSLNIFSRGSSKKIRQSNQLC